MRRKFRTACSLLSALFLMLSVVLAGPSANVGAIAVDEVGDFQVLLSSYEAGDVAEVTLSFEATKPLEAEIDYIDIPSMTFVELDPDEGVAITVDGVEYEAEPDPDEHEFIRLYVPVKIEAGQKVEIWFESFTLPSEEGVLSFALSTSVNSDSSQVWIQVIDNSDKHPVNVKLTPVNEDREEIVAYTGETTSYEITFTTETHIEEGYRIDLVIPIMDFGIVGMGDALPPLDIDPDSAAQHVEISVTDSVYHSTGIHINHDGVLEISTDGHIPAHAEVTVLLKDLLINPSLPGLYLIGIEVGGGGWIDIPLTIYQDDDESHDPVWPPVIEDLELKLSNYNEYIPSEICLGEGMCLETPYVFGNGENVKYTFTGTAPIAAEDLSLRLDDLYFMDGEWGIEPSISGVSLKINEEDIPVEASLDGSIAFIYSAESAPPFVIQQGDSFELQIIMNNPSIDKSGTGGGGGEPGIGGTSVSPTLELQMGEATGAVTPKIDYLTQYVMISEAYAGIQNGEYLINLVNMGGPVSQFTIHFPDEVELPDVIAPDAIEIIDMMHIEGDPLQLEQVIIDGQSIKFYMNQPFISSTLFVHAEAGIPTPSVAGEYEYMVTIGQTNVKLPTHFSAIPQPDPKAVMAKLDEWAYDDEYADDPMINVVFDKELDRNFIGLPLQFFIDFLEDEMIAPAKVHYEFAGEDYEIPVCYFEINEWDARLAQFGLCQPDEFEIDFAIAIEQIESSTEAYVTFDNLLFRHPDGSFSEGQQRVKIMTGAVEQAIESKLMEYVPEDEQLDISMLLRATSDEAMVDLFGGELNVFYVQMLLQFIEPKFVDTEIEPVT